MGGRSSNHVSHHNSSSRHSTNIKTRHSTGGGVGALSRPTRTSNTGISHVTSKSSASAMGNSTSSTRKRYSESRKLDSPEAELSDVDMKISKDSPGVTTVLSDATATRRTSASARNRIKSTSTTTATVTKPISPNPSESSSGGVIGIGSKTSSCNSPDLVSSTGGGKSAQSGMYIDTTSLQWENKHLKDLVVSQLDLIQQQSETILEREKQLKDLRMENEHLRQRLERMERRVRGTSDSTDGGETPDSRESSTIPPLISSNQVTNGNTTNSKEIKMLISESASTPATNPRKRTFSSSVEPSRQRSSTPPVIPAKRIKRESGGTYAIVTTTSTAKVASPVTVKRKSQLVTTPATPSSILLPAKTSSMSSASLKTTPSLLPSKQQLQSALSSAVVKSSTATTTGPIKSNNLNATANARIVSDFDRFDELTDEIFEESDVRFRICHEDAKSGIGAGAILEQVVPSAATGKRKKSESAASDVNGKDKAGKVKPPHNQQRAYSKQPGQYVDGSEESDNAKLPANLGPLEPLQTTYHYYVGCIKELVNKDDKLTECSLLHQLGVEVPNFREDLEYDKRMSKIRSSNKRNPYNRYKDEVEGSEDAVYLKRHDKPEQLEKKTKKWDIQRLREQQRVEKLRARYDQSVSKNKKQQPDTLLPSPEDADRILISGDGKLPVSVFGESVPNFIQSNFVLPWIGKRQSKLDSTKRTRQSHPSSGTKSTKH